MYLFAIVYFGFIEFSDLVMRKILEYSILAFILFFNSLLLLNQTILWKVSNLSFLYFLAILHQLGNFVIDFLYMQL